MNLSTADMPPQPGPGVRLELRHPWVSAEGGDVEAARDA